MSAHTCTPVIKTANCSHCGRFLSLRNLTCKHCGGRVIWGSAITPAEAPVVPARGTRERVDLEWHVIERVREHLPARTSAAVTSPSDVALIVSLALDTVAGRGLANVVPASGPVEGGTR